ncbi:hypothetical protein BD413DRAFT_446127, partial [Trametes elegans]
HSGIPVEVQEHEDPTVGIDDSWVIQPNIRHFFGKKDVVPPESSALSSDSSEEVSPRLLLFKLTLAGTETAIGVSWHHALGDATVMERFMRTLSQAYQCIQPDERPAPVFTKRIFPAPTTSLLERYTP